jgi:transposase
LVAAELETFQADDQRPAMIFFQDEATFGRMGNPVRCWAPLGIRPLIPMQRVREYLYSYSAISIQTGENFSLILPRTNGYAMFIFLQKMSEQYSDYKVILIMDQAAWHKTQKIPRFANIRIIFQPSGSPELNGAEHFWDHLREKYFDNRISKSLDELEERLIYALNDANSDNQKPLVRSLVAFNWISQII